MRSVRACGLATLLCGACTALSGVGDLTSSSSSSPDQEDGSTTTPNNNNGADGSTTTPINNDAGNNNGGDTGVGPLVDSSSPTDSIAPLPDTSVVPPTSRCDTPPTDPNLLAFYAFDDGAGASVKDCSGHGHPGAIVGTPSWTANGKHGGALTFNGTNNCVDIGAAAALQTTTLTIAAWVNVADYTGAGVNGYIIGKTASNAGTLGWRFSTVEAPNMFEAKIAAAPPFTITSPGGQTLNTWIHVGLVLTAGRADVYLGGARVTHITIVPTILEDAPASLRIGCNDGAKDYFKGTIDDLLIYKRALSDAEVAALAL